MKTKCNLKHILTTTIAVIALFNMTLSIASEQTVIALIGDSITVGYNASYLTPNGNGTTTHGLPTISLNTLLKNRNTVVSNWGVGGSSSAYGSSNITSFLNTTTSQHSGDAYYTLIIYGTNDFGHGIGSSTTGFNNGQMIDKARSAGYEPIIGTLTPRSDQLSQIPSTNAQIISNANAKSAFVVDHYTRFINEPGGWETLIDVEISALTGNSIRLHPNDDGYIAIAENWFDSRLKDIIDLEVNIAPIISLLLDD